MNEKTKFLSNLGIGASACVANADRLISDAELLFYNQSYLSSFFLSELAIEEMGKGFKLLEWISLRRKVPRKDWESLTKRSAHVNKLKIAQEADDEWLSNVTKGLGINYSELLKSILSKMPSAKNVDEYRDTRAKESFERRKSAMYVDYDFEREEWDNPLDLSISSNPNFSRQRLTLAQHLIQVLRASIRKTEERNKHE